MAIFNSYVKLPEGILEIEIKMKKGRFLWDESRILPYDFMGTKMKG
jgi:hypothetical protein